VTVVVFLVFDDQCLIDLVLVYFVLCQPRFIVSWFFSPGFSFDFIVSFAPEMHLESVHVSIYLQSINCVFENLSSLNQAASDEGQNLGQEATVWIRNSEVHWTAVWADRGTWWDNEWDEEEN